MSGVSDALATKVLNASTPTGTSGAPGTWAAYTGGAMKVRLNSAAGTAATAGTELTGTGYTAGGTAVPAASTASSSGSSVSLPASSALTWTNGSGSDWSIDGFDLTTSDGVRTWFGSFTGAPITIADGNSFELAVGGIVVDLA